MSRLRSLAFAAASIAALPAPPLAAEGSVAGTITDIAGAPASGVEVTLVSPLGAIAATTRSDASGRFPLRDAFPPDRTCSPAELPGFAARKRAVQVVSKGALDGLELDLQPGGFRDEVTISAAPGRADAQDGVAQRVNVIDEERLALRAKAVLSQVANEEVGLHLQRTSPTMGGIFVRGLTGTKVNVYVDGVRYTTSAQRGGVSTFFNMVEPQALEGIEVVRGPSSAEYGSDALGGTVQLLTRAPSFDPSGESVSGSWSASGGSADLSFGSALVGRYAAPTLGVVGTLAGRRVNTLRAASGEDSRNAVTRFLGLPSDTAIDDGRLPDTAFTQYGGQLRANWAITPTTQLVAGYLRGQQDGGKRYDQLLGGDGNLQADLRNLMVDHLYARLDKAGLGFLERVTLSYSFASQREERVNQGGNGNPLASVNHEPERTVAHGLQATASRSFGRHDLTLGADVFLESIAAPSFATNPTSGATTVRRGRVPDDPSYDHGGVFLQDVFEAVPGRLRLNGAVRFSAASYEVDTSPTLAGNGTPLWPADSYDTSAPTFRIGALFTPSGPLSVAVNVSRGFRAPDITDLGTFGLTGSGYEVSNREVDGLGASVGTTADATAVSTGHAVAVLDPESSLSYELTLRYRSRRLRADLTGFQNDISDNIAKQTLILPPGAARALAGGRAGHAAAAHGRRVRGGVREPGARAHELRRGADPRPGGELRRRADAVLLPRRARHLAARRGPRDRPAPQHRGRDAGARRLAAAALHARRRPTLLDRAVPARRGGAGPDLEPRPGRPAHRRLALAQQHRVFLHERRPRSRPRVAGSGRDPGKRRRPADPDRRDARPGAGARAGAERRRAAALPDDPRIRRLRRPRGGPIRGAPRDPVRPREHRRRELPRRLVGHGRAWARGSTSATP